MNDSSSSVEEFYREKLMERSPEERFMMGIRMFESARSMALASLPADLSTSERSFNLFLRFYGHELDANTQNQVRHLIMEREGKLIDVKGMKSREHGESSKGQISEVGRRRPDDRTEG